MFPTGWYQIAWSDELPAKAVVPLRYFDTDLVLYRTDQGDPVLLDGHCAHMGAHLGYGGRVVECDLVCPYHGWRWDRGGRVVEVPYSAHGNKRARVRAWPVHESLGMIMTWFAPEEAAPSWTPPDLTELLDTDSWFQPGSQERRLWSDARMTNQMLVENVVDVAHTKVVHRAPVLPVIKELHFDGPFARVQQQASFGRSDAPIIGGVDVRLWGLGLMWAQWVGYMDHVALLNATPKTAISADVRTTIWVSRRGEQRDSRRIIENSNAVLALDFPIWEHLDYREHPALVREERAQTHLRAWTAQFYATRAPRRARTRDSGGSDGNG